MDWYLYLKLLHVASAVIWIGGAFIMVMLGNRADRSADEKILVDVVRQVAWAADRVYVPASISTLVFGLILAWFASLWGNLWIILGLLGVASTVGLGILVLTPLAKRAEAGFKTSGTSPDVVATCREILTLAKFDLVLLFTVIADMVLKPGPSDWLLLLIMALVLLAAAIFWLVPVLSRKPVVAG
jgi:uncharacterized membrane protein